MKNIVFFTYKYIIVAVGLLFGQVTVDAAENKTDFPGRALYPAVHYIELNKLNETFQQSVIVDVRSDYEYQTLRIKGAINIPLSGRDFTSKMQILRKESGTKNIIVYCNGKTCMKSYKAAQICQNKKINNVIAYDAGIMDWAKAYPENSVLLGQSPVDARKIIRKADFQKHLLPPGDFEKNLSNRNIILIDLRDQFQRDATGIFVGLEERVFLDDKKGLKKFIAKANKEKKTLYVYDEAGKQVRWLMYFLEENKAKSYYFMKGGARGYFKELRKKYTS